MESLKQTQVNDETGSKYLKMLMVKVNVYKQGKAPPFPIKKIKNCKEVLKNSMECNSLSQSILI